MANSSSVKVASGTVHNVPADLREMLVASSKILKHWNSLTPLARNEWICWVVSPKKPETRSAHIERAAEDLKNGERRPCCWYGCIHRTDKKVSPSVQAIVINKKLNSKK